MSLNIHDLDKPWTTLAPNSHIAMEIGSPGSKPQDYAETGVYMAKNVTVA